MTHNCKKRGCPLALSIDAGSPNNYLTFIDTYGWTVELGRSDIYVNMAVVPRLIAQTQAGHHE